MTDEGRSFLADAKRLLALAAETVESVRRLHSGEVRALNVGYVSNLFYDLLPKTLASFRQSFPTVSVNLFDLSCGDQFRALEDGKLDLGFVGLHEPIARRGLQFRTIASYKTVVALPKNNPLARKTDGESQSPRADVLHRHVRSELSLLSRLVNQDVRARGLYSQGFAGCRSRTNYDSRRRRRIGGCSRARAIQKTRARECCVPATESHRQDGRLCRMEGRESVGCSESVRADRRASGPQHPLNRTVAGFGRVKIKAQIEKSGRRGERDFDQWPLIFSGRKARST